jgi:hypothetical protein
MPLFLLYSHHDLFLTGDNFCRKIRT